MQNDQWKMKVDCRGLTNGLLPIHTTVSIIDLKKTQLIEVMKYFPAM